MLIVDRLPPKLFPARAFRATLSGAQGNPSVFTMNQYAVLTTRRRAVIAFVHSVFFFSLALAGFSERIPPLMAAWAGRSGAPLAPALGMVAVYFVVTGVLLWLVLISAGRLERVYFAFCAASAATGLLRSLVGDTPQHAGACLRVLMLGSAIVACARIWRSHQSVRY
jgi:hypothetical protein